MKIEGKLIGQIGFVQYYFKGMQMSKERGVVIDQDSSLIIVKQDPRDQLINFIKNGNRWLLANSLNNPLVGTEFIFDESNSYKKSI